MRTLRADWIFPATSPPIADGRISIEGSQIVRVGGADPAYPVDQDLGAVAIVPGFVNAHTHLELAPIPRAIEGYPDHQLLWLSRVMISRHERSAASVAAGIDQNIRDAIAAGTTALADITTEGKSWEAVAGAPVRAIVYTEVLGLKQLRGLHTWKAALEWLQRITNRNHDWQKTRPGISPHAPYSTAGWMYWEATESSLPLSSHLGEMPEEREFLRDRTGPIREFVDAIDAYTDDWKPIGPSPINYVLPLTSENRFGGKSGWIIAHGNIFEPHEFARLVTPPNAAANERIAVAYCPRTHDRFAHPPHPFRAMLGAGVVVCLGTDSLASTPSLSILDEVRFLHRHHPDVPGATLLRMATISGAWAMNIDDQTGSLEPGKSADLAVLPLGKTGSDPHSGWLDDTRPPLATMFMGEVVAGALKPVR